MGNSYISNVCGEDMKPTSTSKYNISVYFSLLNGTALNLESTVKGPFIVYHCGEFV